MRKGAAEVLIAGAGVWGLAAALECARRGLSVLVVEAAAPGAGASGGLVGALSPHAPHPWSARKAAQRATLAAAPAFWAGVAAESGVDPGYAVVGRAIPLADPAARDRAEAAAAAAARHWAPDTWRLAAADSLPGWLAPAAAPHGLVLETLSARIVPRRAVAAFAAALAARGVEIVPDWPVTAVEDGALRSGSRRLSARLVVLATGAGTRALVPDLPLAAVKGQAALVAAAAPPGAPLIGAGDLWIVPRPDGVAVGATAEPEWTDPAATDPRLDALVARARALCPALADAPIVERWAGLRPRGARPDPLIARVSPRVLVATGGFRTGLATAPQAGALVAAIAAGETPDLPPGWSLAEHRATAAKSR
ncbi:FAD-dependent oxidoreductase [Amaricoccus sp.]|uniref:NAD(P)/FAD-dependent oxidoreductase n=1 Tax=Amaricoccus sp. TaxID=1872485 RepID=UPI001B657F19|nr:FAD-dependent oxidoreductase [Amaricoccus sp.]MBP7242572.1 FAD-binding oxidoreductase [Amaricoccus sp.]